MDKIKVFEKEYTYMKNERIIESLKILINLLPDYFFEVAASSTGKYHPSFTLGSGGLIRHTKAAVRIAYELLNNNSVNNYKDDEKDLIILALMLHDGIKHGEVKDQYTKFDHPLLASKFIKDNKDKTSLTDDEIEYICEAIESHMGEWTKDYSGNEVLPSPKSKHCRFVHMCDYLASRKFLNINFDNNNNIIE